jgi:RHS repeat-associated protein
VRAYRFDGPLNYYGSGVDLLQDNASTTEIWLNTGVSWTKMVSPPYIPTIANPYVIGGYWWGNERVLELADIDGDGGVDMNNYKNNASRQDLLRRVVLPTGGWIDATTTPTAKHTTSSHPTHANLPMNVWTVTDFTTNDGFGNTETHSYNYQGGLLWYGGVNDRKFAGFSSVKDTFDGGYTISYFHQGSTTESSAGEYADMYAKIGKPYRTETYQNGSGDPITVSIYKWDQATTSFSTLFPKLVQKIDMSYDANSDHRDTAETYTYNDNTGDITQKKEWGEVTASSDGTFSDTGSDLFTTDYTYATDASSTAVYLSTESRTDQSAASTSESRYYYDNQALGTVTLGNRTKVERRIDASNFASTTRAYNAYGLPTLDRDENYASTTYSYDIYNLYPATSTNAIGQNTFYQYNYLLGKVGTTTDANGQVWVTRYDGRGRLIKEEAPDPTTAGSRVTKASYIYNDTPLSVSVHKSDYLDATNTIESFKYVDGFGRAIQTKQEAENSNWIEKDMSYDSRGRLYRESLPYFTASSSRDTATTSSALFATYLYDPLGRVKELGIAVGTTTTTYDQWKKSVTNPLSKVMAYYNDAYNNLARVDENNGTSTYSTYYVWDGNRALTSITDALSNVRTFTYDKLGRRTQATDLHASGDGTYGTYSYTYDKAGNMTVKTTPVGATINYTYDALNRLKTEDYTGQSGTEVTYVYDSCTMGTGQLCTASTSAATTTYTYTPQGKVKTEAKAISGTTYTTQYAYDRAGNMTLLTYPDNAQAQYTYNGGGQIETVQKKENGESSFANIVTNFDYSPVGQPTSIAYANGATTTNTYNPSALYRLSNKLSVLPGSSRAQDISYTYDALGNITQINDQSATGAGKVVNYGYDDLSRMLTASTTAASSSPYAYTYAYNALGNITNGPLGAYSYTGNTGSSYANPHAVTTIGTTTGSSAATTTIHTVYAESLTPGWADWSWSTTLDSANTSPVKTGTYSLKSTHTVAWGGMYLHNTGLGTATSTHLSFSVRSPNAGAYIELEAYGPSDVLLGNVQLNSYIPGGSLAADTWYDVAIPLADLHATSTTLTGIVAMRSTTGSEYWDDMKLVNVTAGSGGSASTTLAYDQNGNLTSDGALTYTWDYRNRLTQTTTGTTTSTYTYDHADSRVKLVEGSVTTLFPNKFYNAMIGGAATTTKHIFAGNLLLATVENASSTGGSSGGGTATSTPTLDATSTSITTGFATGPVTKTWTHTVATAGTSTILILYGDIWQDVGGSGTITSAKWNGGSFTKLGNARSGGMATELWYLVPTTTGAKTMSVTVTGATDAIKLAAASFTGISTTTTVDATSTATGTTGNPTISVTTHAVGNLVTATLSRFSTTDATTNRTSLYKDKVTSTLGAASYQVATATGSYSDTYTGSANQDWSTIMGTFRAATTSTATSSGSTASSTVRYMLADHLGSTNVITNASGTVVEVLDYLPYGETRMDTKTGSYVGEKRKYIGQELDGGTGLSYLNARYYNNSRGNFASEDPVFWGKQQLENPQSMNSYGYAGRNPISQLDDSGKAFYYFTDGHVEFHGTTGYTHTESGDNAYFAGNAGEMERQSGSLQAYNTFYNHVHSGGDWDFKSAHDAWQSDGFIFGGKWYNAEDSGNLNYGYTGTAAGIGPSILTDVAGLVQVKNSLPVGTHTNNGISFSNARYNFDDAGDNLMILKGINMYLQTRANANSVSSMNAQESSYIGTRTAGLTPQSTLKLMSAALAIASKTVQLLKAATDAGK